MHITITTTVSGLQGYADHVPPPVGVPPGDDLAYTELAQDRKNYTFSFDRLGLRYVQFVPPFIPSSPRSPSQTNSNSVPTLVISPWVEKGALEHLGQNGAIYSHSSLPAFISKVFPFLPCSFYQRRLSSRGP